MITDRRKWVAPTYCSPGSLPNDLRERSLWLEFKSPGRIRETPEFLYKAGSKGIRTTKEKMSKWNRTLTRTGMHILSLIAISASCFERISDVSTILYFIPEWHKWMVFPFYWPEAGEKNLHGSEHIGCAEADIWWVFFTSTKKQPLKSNNCVCAHVHMYIIYIKFH